MIRVKTLVWLTSSPSRENAERTAAGSTEAGRKKEEIHDC